MNAMTRDVEKMNGRIGRRIRPRVTRGVLYPENSHPNALSRHSCTWLALNEDSSLRQSLSFSHPPDLDFVLHLGRNTLPLGFPKPTCSSHPSIASLVVDIQCTRLHHPTKNLHVPIFPPTSNGIHPNSSPFPLHRVDTGFTIHFPLYC